MPILDGVLPRSQSQPLFKPFDATLLRFYRLILYPNFNERNHFTYQAKPYAGPDNRV